MLLLKKNNLLEKRIFLENLKISKFKNFIIKFFCFGCYDKNKKIDNKLKKNQDEISKISTYQTKFNIEYKTIKNKRNALIEKITKLYKNIKTKHNNIIIDKINAAGNQNQKSLHKQTYNN